MHSDNISQGLRDTIHKSNHSSTVHFYFELLYFTVDISKFWENAVLWNAGGSPGSAGLLHEDLTIQTPWKE